MISCPIKQCGRKFENDQTMFEHVRRRHPNQYNSIRQQATKSMIEKEHAQQQQLNKLPRLAKIMSRQKKQIKQKSKQKIIETHKRSDSKTRKLQSANLSTIIKQSRMTTANSKNSIAGRRPSLNKKASLSDIKIDKLPPIQNYDADRKIESKFQVKQTIKKEQNTQQFYTTMPDFKSKGSLNLRPKQRIKSIGKKNSQQKLQQKNKQLKQQTIQTVQTNNNTLRNTMTILATQKNINQLNAQKKKGFLRPAKKIQKKLSQKTSHKTDQIATTTQPKYDFNQKTVTVKFWSQSTFICPTTSKVEYLYLNNCNLQKIDLSSLESLIQFSATHNKLKSMQFLHYNKNHNIKVVHVDHNQILQVYTPPKIKVFTASFNQLKAQTIDQVLSALKKSTNTTNMEQIDFSFNGIRKANNYKLRLLSACPKLKKIDGLTVTKIDIEMMQQYNILTSKQKGLIPLGSPSQDRPITAQQSEHQTSDNLLTQKSITQLQKQNKQYTKLICQTQQQLKIITQQNQIISSQIQLLNKQTKQMTIVWDSTALLQKLQKQCQFLQLLNIMQYADQEQLANMIIKKKNQLGIQVD